MVSWSNFYQDAYEPEIMYGPYEQLISRIGLGPTQAERVLIHTAIMETAHERRFTVAQDAIDMATFSATHCRRISGYISHLQNFFQGHTSTRACELESPDDRYMIGIVPASSNWRTGLDLLSAQPPYVDELCLSTDTRKRRSSTSRPEGKRKCVSRSPLLEAMDEDVLERSSSETIPIISRIGEHVRRMSSQSPRQHKGLRQRKRPALSPSQKQSVQNGNV